MSGCKNWMNCLETHSGWGLYSEKEKGDRVTAGCCPIPVLCV